MKIRLGDVETHMHAVIRDTQAQNFRLPWQQARKNRAKIFRAALTGGTQEKRFSKRLERRAQTRLFST